jgi:hypothetical protein
MTTLQPLWYNGNGYHVLLIDGWRLMTKNGASKYVTGLNCDYSSESYGKVHHNIFESYSELIFGSKIYGIYWHEGVFRIWGFEPYGKNLSRDKENTYGYSLSYNISSEDFKKYLKNRIQLIEENKPKLTEHLPPTRYIGRVEI